MKRFSQGLIFGAGFAVAFLVICTVALLFAFPMMFGNDLFPTSQQEEVRSPPEIHRGGRYLGSLGTYSGDFTRDQNNRVLSSGPGKIVGVAKVDGEPLDGLRLRFALNGNVMSQWATTGTAGHYEIGVPYGEYRIDGFDLDTQNANSVLPGKIGHPQNPYTSGTFDVAAGAPGQGLNLAFVDPVVLDISKNRFSADEEIVIRWHPYEGAQEYKVQILESPDARQYGRSEAVFPWDECPVLKEPQINLADYGVELKDGHYYTVHVEARADSWRPISKTPIQNDGFHFQIVD